MTLVIFSRRMLLILCVILGIAETARAAEQPPAKAPPQAALQIEGLQDRDGIDIVAKGTPKKSIGLNDDLAVVLNTTGPIDASHYVLFLNGHEIDGLDQTFYDANSHTLVFHLARNTKNASAWATLLGRPTDVTMTINVALGEHPLNNIAATPSIAGPKGQRPAFLFKIFSAWKLVVTLGFVLGMLVLVWGGARRTTIMKDNEIPQIEPACQTYSLGRWQMAVWFSLIFASYVFLFIALGDINTLSSQALILMGLSGTTALVATAVDAIKDSPADAANQGLRLLGIKDYTDVVRIRAEIADRQIALNAQAANATQLQSEILDRELLLRTYAEAIKPFLSQGWFQDISTDQNGPALHRLQVVCWTLLLGAIFVFGVWSNLAMPEFSNILLALVGISGSGYVGFKYTEVGQ